MNKLAEKVVPAMNDEELEALIDDHYVGEAQTLTTGAEPNLLKLAELRGTHERRAARRAGRASRRSSGASRRRGGGDDDPVTRVTGTLGGLGRELEGIRDTLLAAADRAAQHAQSQSASEAEARKAEADARRAEATALAQAQSTRGAGGDALAKTIAPQLAALQAALERLANPHVEVKVEAPPMAVAGGGGGTGGGGGAPGPGVNEATLARQIEIMRDTIMPLVQSTSANLEDAKEMHEHIIQLLDLVRRMDEKLRDRYGF